MDLRGSNLIAGRESTLGQDTFASVDPRTGRAAEIAFREATGEEVRQAARAAAQASRELRTWSTRRLAPVLRTVADALEETHDQIVQLADRETALGVSRLEGELARTTGQLRSFARLLEEGWHLGAIIDTASEGRPDVRRMLVPLGPVAVFGASNFPLAFGVAGGDTASALAAGCPVVVKGHPSHPGTCELVGRLVARAVAQAGAPAGTFSLLQGSGPRVGKALVLAPEIKAVGFTGSHAGGRFLHELGATRDEPIPVYSEMGSLNPVFVLPKAARARTTEIAEGLVESMTVGLGQFCTKPGLAIIPQDGGGEELVARATEILAQRPAGPMLNERIWRAFRDKLGQTSVRPGVEVVVEGPVYEGEGFVCSPSLLATDLEGFLATPDLTEEHFGPVSVIVRCEPDSWEQVVARLPGSLTATIHAEPSEYEEARVLQHLLVEKAGRIVWNGYPTGVAVVPSMHHGGPYPATSNPAHTSVGMTAIRRFLRPVAYQEAPNEALPEALQDENPLGVLRLVDWRWTTDPIRAGRHR
jgi:2,5-dioxopentanoate dehydrogenase